VAAYLASRHPEGVPEFQVRTGKRVVLVEATSSGGKKRFHLVSRRRLARYDVEHRSVQSRALLNQIREGDATWGKLARAAHQAGLDQGQQLDVRGMRILGGAAGGPGETIAVLKIENRVGMSSLTTGSGREAETEVRWLEPPSLEMPSLEGDNFARAAERAILALLEEHGVHTVYLSGAVDVGVHEQAVLFDAIADHGTFPGCAIRIREIDDGLLVGEVQTADWSVKRNLIRRFPSTFESAHPK
jgi:hypothetical protein